MDFADLQDRLLFGIPKKGRLHEQCLKLLEGADIQFHRKNRLDIALSTNLPLALIFLPASDIATHMGITGQDMVAEGKANIQELLPLGFGKCDLCFQVPVGSPYTTPESLIGKRIVTSFESITQDYFRKLEGTSNFRTKISYVSGSVEAACALGLADAIVDLVESGETMRAAKLRSIGTILSSQAILLSNSVQHPLVDKIKSRIEGVITAQRYVLCKVDFHLAVKITPGRKAPTVSPLENEGWVAVSSMVKTSQVADIMDQLSAVGAQDIIVFSIHNCRVE